MKLIFKASNRILWVCALAGMILGTLTECGSHSERAQGVITAKQFAHFTFENLYPNNPASTDVAIYFNGAPAPNYSQSGVQYGQIWDKVFCGTAHPSSISKVRCTATVPGGTVEETVGPSQYGTSVKLVEFELINSGGQYKLLFEGQDDSGHEIQEVAKAK